LFASGLIGLGALVFVLGDVPLSGQPGPTLAPGRSVLAGFLCAVLWFCALSVWQRRPSAIATWVLLAFTALWWLGFKLPPLLAAPTVELNWLECGMIGMVVLASMVVHLERRRQRSPGAFDRTEARVERALPFLYGAALLPIGLSHYFYRDVSAGMVPHWLPVTMFWVYLGGVGHFAAGLGILFNVRRKLAAVLEAAMLTVFTAMVWIPGVVATPSDPSQWSELVMSWLIAAAAWVLAAWLVAPERGNSSADSPGA
jgi:uncharacterized membrane protein